jgi:hypothetical protein
VIEWLAKRQLHCEAGAFLATAVLLGTSTNDRKGKTK